METLEKMFQHLQWSNKRILDTLKSSQVEDVQIIRLFSHILYAENVWLTRLRGLDSSQLPIWGDADVEECAKMMEWNHQNLSQYISGLSETELGNIIIYKNSKGVEFQSSVRDILTHIGLHGHYHRGQINQRLRIEGLEPASVDYIYFVR